MNQLPLVTVKWIDITTQNGWMNQEEADDFVMDREADIVMQAGFLYEEDENQIVLLNSYFKNKDLFGDLTKIPKGNVIELIKF